MLVRVVWMVMEIRLVRKVKMVREVILQPLRL